MSIMNNFSRRFRGISVLGALLGLSVVAVQSAAAADTLFTLNTGNIGGLDCCTGPYAKADIALVDSTHATVTFDSLINGGFIYLMGGQNAADVNVNATSWTIGSILGTNSLSGFTPGPYTNDGSNTVDGFGIFNQTVKSFDGFTHSADHISFSLINTGGTWATSADVVTKVAIHGFACAEPGCNSTTGAFATGFATSTAPIPEPEIYAMMAAGLGLMGFVARRRKQQLAAA